MGLKLKKNSRSYVMLLCFMGIFAALQFVTEYYLSITIAGKYRISFTFLIRAITGYCIGWLGGIVSALADILGGFILYPGSMNPGITLTRLLQGFCVGLILFRRCSTVRIVLASAIDNLILSLFVNSYFIFAMLGTPYRLETLAPRAIIPAISFVLEIVLLQMMDTKLIPAVRPLLYKGIWAQESPSEAVRPAAPEISAKEESSEEELSEEALSKEELHDQLEALKEETTEKERMS